MPGSKRSLDTVKLSRKSQTKSVSTWGVIRGFDNAVAKMNACFSNMLYELQKPDILAKEAIERRKMLKEKRKQDLLRGCPFNLKTGNRAVVRPPRSLSTGLIPDQGMQYRSLPSLPKKEENKGFNNFTSPPRRGSLTPRNIMLMSPKVLRRQPVLGEIPENKIMATQPRAGRNNFPTLG